MENYTSFYGKGPKSFYNKGNSYGGLIETTQSVTIGPLNIASFNTNIEKPLKKLLVNIDPIQDLHGYNNPWPGGGGNNRLNPQTVPDANSYVIASLGTIITPAGSSVWRHSDYIPVTPGEELYFGQITFKSSSAGTAFYDSNKTYISGVTGTNLSAANNILTVPENAAFMRHSWAIQNGYNPDWENTVYIVPNSAPHEFTPYANICPITGWTGAKVTRCGKNLMAKPFLVGVHNPSGYNPNNSNVISTDGFYLKAGTYIISDVEITISKNLYVNRMVNETKADAGYQKYYGANRVVTIPADGLYNFQYNGTNITSVLTALNASAQLELGSTVTSYEPYQGETYDITFPTEAGTVYGGTLDLTAGTLTVDRAMLTKNTADMNNNESYPGWRNAGIKALVGAELAIPITSMLNIGTQFSVNTRGSNDILFLPTYIYGKTQTEWIAEAIDVQIVVPLATPVTYQLTPQQIATLLGENNVWADTGDIEKLTYLIKK